MVTVKISLFWHNQTRRTESQLAACRKDAKDGIEKERVDGVESNGITFRRKSEG